MLISLLTLSNVFAQKITISDYSSQKPIANVYIYDLDKKETALTDSLGQADISKFDKDEQLIFSHSSYQMIIIRKRELYATDYNLSLHKKIVDLNELIVSANKRPQTKKEIPNRIETITSKDAEFGNPQTAADLLNNSGQVFVQKSQLGGGSPMIRGFSANSVLIAVDGIRMNNAIFRSGNLQNVISIDPLAIEKTEVLYGPGSVIYGSDALGGVMDFITKDPILSDSAKLKTKANMLTRYSSANKEKTLHLDLSIAGKRLGSFTSFTFSGFDDLKMGTDGPSDYTRPEFVKRINGVDSIVTNSDINVQKESGYEQSFLVQKFMYKVNEHIKMKYAFLYATTSDVPRYDRLIQSRKGKLRYGEWKYGPQNWMMNSLTFSANTPNVMFDHLNVSVAWQKFQESRHNRNYQSNTRKNRTEKVDVVSVNFDFDNAISARSAIYYGYEGVGNWVDSKAEKENIVTKAKDKLSTRYPDGATYFTHAFYANYKLNLDKKTTFVAGMRYSHIDMRSKVDTSFYPLPEPSIDLNTGSLTGSLGWAYRPTEKWQVNLNLASGFRAPNIDDAAKVFDSEPGQVIVPNPDLKPENIYTIDLGFHRKIGSIAGVELTGFYSSLNNAMVRGDYKVNGQDSIIYDGEMSKVEAIVNTASAKIYGFHINGFVDVYKGIQLKAAYTLTKGETNKGVAVRHVSPAFGSAHMIYSDKRMKLDLYGVYNGQINYSTLAPDERDKPHLYAKDGTGQPFSPWWYTLNVKYSLSIGKMVEMGAGIENILDKRYRPYSSGITAPGRNFIVSMKATLG